MSGNFMLALLEAVSKDQNTMGWTQLADATAAINDANIEQAIYSRCNNELQYDARLIDQFISQNPDFSKPSVQAFLQELNNTYQKDSTLAQTYQGQADSAVQAAQSQSGQDGQNLANKAQLAQTLVSILSTLSSMLAQHY